MLNTGSSTFTNKNGRSFTTNPSSIAKLTINITTFGIYANKLYYIFKTDCMGETMFIGDLGNSEFNWFFAIAKQVNTPNWKKLYTLKLVIDSGEGKVECFMSDEEQ